MRHGLVLLVLVLSSGAPFVPDTSEASGYQATGAPERFDMQEAEDRWVQIGSKFFLLLIVVLLVKKSLDKRKKPPSRSTPARRPPPRR